MKNFLLSLILVTGWVASAFAGDEEYFPMAVGYRWEAQVQHESLSGEKRYTLAVREIVGKKKIGDHEYFEERSYLDASKDQVSTSYRRIDAKGVYLVFKEGGEYKEVLEFPLPLSYDLNWSVKTADALRSYAVIATNEVTIANQTYPALVVESYEGRQQESSKIYLAKGVGSVHEVVKIGNTTLTFILKSFTKK